MQCLAPTDGQWRMGSCQLTCLVRCLERGCSSAASVGGGRTLLMGGNPMAPCTHLTGYGGLRNGTMEWCFQPPAPLPSPSSSHSRSIPGSGTTILLLCSATRAGSAQYATALYGSYPTPTVPPWHLAAAQPDRRALAMPHSSHTQNLRKRFCPP